MSAIYSRNHLGLPSPNPTRILVVRPPASIHCSANGCSSSALCAPLAQISSHRRRASQACAAGAQVPVASVATLSEVGQNTFWPAVRGAGDKLVVAYFFGDKCVQCKAMYPQLVDMANELAPQQVLFVKFNCKKENKDLGIELGIKRSPTFQLYHKGKKLGEMIGAKPDELRLLIENTKERGA